MAAVMSTPSSSALALMTPEQWRAEETDHAARVDEHVTGHLSRRKEHRKHPIEDFLFVYYSNSPGKLRRYSPGAGVGLLVDTDDRTPMSGERFVTRVRTPQGWADTVDVEAFVQARGRTLGFVDGLLNATAQRTGNFSCFGLHEWAMVYGLKPGEQRHEQLPLRLGQTETDAVVERSTIRCSHFDAYRFFTPDAVDRNTLRPTRERQSEFEQPACLHAGMDLYKWAYKLFPLVSSALVLEAFELAKRVRTLDMEASPYDVTDLGYGVVPVETPAGRAEYVRRQREFADEGQRLRARLAEAIAGPVALARSLGD